MVSTKKARLEVSNEMKAYYPQHQLIMDRWDGGDHMAFWWIPDGAVLTTFETNSPEQRILMTEFHAK